MDGEIWVSADGEELLSNVHPRAACVGRHCVLHNPSEHHMREWPLRMRETGLMERKCPHGIGHPDPDSLAYFRDELRLEGWGIHGCDGCCHEPLPGDLQQRVDAAIEQARADWLGALSELADRCDEQAQVPVIRQRDEALANSLAFVALRLRRFLDESAGE